MIIVSSVFIGMLNIMLSFIIQNIIDSKTLKFSLIFLLLLVSVACLYPVIYRYNIKSLQILKLNEKEILLKKIIEKYHNLEFVKKEQMKVADYVMLFNEDIDNYSSLVSNFYIPLFKHIITILIALIYGFYYSYQISLIVIIFVIVYHIMNHFVASKTEKYRHVLMNDISNRRQFLYDLIDNIPIYRIITSKKNLHMKLQNYVDMEISSNKKIISREILGRILSEAPIQAIEFIVFLLGMYYALKGNMTLGVVVGLWNGLIGSLLWSSIEIPYIYNDYSKINVSKKRIKQFLDDEQESKMVHLSENNSKSGIKIQNISYKYENKKEILKYPDMYFAEQGIYIISGDSGCGKTTLAKIIANLYYPLTGHIIKNQSEKITYIPQKSEIFPFTIRENIDLLNKFSDDYILKYLDIVDISSLLSQNSERNLNSLIDENTISGGEARRINIVRALLENSQFIIMDEPFSDLDYEQQFH